MKTVDGITIDKEFAEQIPPLSREEYQQLEANLLEAGGAREPLIVWDRGDKPAILLDGHNRFEICRAHDLRFDVDSLKFPNRTKAAEWIDRNQLGRRNLSKQDFAMILGRLYNRTKKTPAEAGALKGKAAGKMSTASVIAKEHGVDEKTVRRAGELQAAAAKLGIEKKITAGNVKAPAAKIIEAAKSLPPKPTARQLAKAVREVEKKPPAKKPQPRSSPILDMIYVLDCEGCFDAIRQSAGRVQGKWPERKDELVAVLMELLEEITRETHD
jgi:hypothetical protein